jgi:hypothetical protein
MLRHERVLVHQICLLCPVKETDFSTESGQTHNSVGFTDLFSPQCKKEVQAAPCSTDARCVDFEAIDVEVGGEQEDGRKYHGQGLEGAKVLCRDEGSEECRRKGGFCD